MSIKEQGSRKGVVIWKRIVGIVRHYHTPKSDHCPYRGLLMTEQDEQSEFGQLYKLLANFPDGEHITITIESHGTHPGAKGYMWMLTKPHHYERVKTNKY